MSMKISLAPGERLLVGRALITNGPTPAELKLDSDQPVPVLRERLFMRPDEADTPCKQLYLAIQILYVQDGDYFEVSNHFMALAKDICAAAPSLKVLVADVSTLVMAGRHVEALERCLCLISAEERILSAIPQALAERQEGAPVH
jgi:flagellar protein FlbT